MGVPPFLVPLQKDGPWATIVTTLPWVSVTWVRGWKLNLCEIFSLKNKRNSKLFHLGNHIKDRTVQNPKIPQVISNPSFFWGGRKNVRQAGQSKANNFSTPKQYQLLGSFSSHSPCLPPSSYRIFCLLIPNYFHSVNPSFICACLISKPLRLYW